MKTCIDGSFNGWSGDTAFELCNGQVWVQAEYAYLYHYAYRPDVEIAGSRSGWTMQVAGVRERLSVLQTDFVRSQINGEFTGWSGDTLFELSNGQTWQQARYEYRYRYAYRPAVLIYRTRSGGYKLRTDAGNETIEVRRVR